MWRHLLHYPIIKKSVFAQEQFQNLVLAGRSKTGMFKVFARRATCGEMNICGGRPFRPIYKKYNNNNSNDSINMVYIYLLY